ncbi:MAG: protease modulator HflC [Planctomycetota bacterium]|nr:MAG: protease modulator HflC [Planctomycetota bacterium]
MSRRIAQLVITGVALLGILAIASQLVVYVVDQRQLAVVLRFGEPVRANTEPGLYFKAPIVETVRILPATLQFWGDDPSENMPDLPTKDNKKIELTPWAVWKINDPILFVKRLRTMENAQNRVAQFTRGAMRDVITQYDLEDLVRSTDREMRITEIEFNEEDMKLLAGVLPENELTAPKPKRKVIGRLAILQKIKDAARRSLRDEAGSGEGARGIELVDLGISHIDFVPEVRRTTFERWIAEREAISTRNIKEGEQQKQEILNLTNREIETIRGEGQREASEIRGQADAKVIRRYAEAIGQVGEFYTFVRTLEAYEKALDDRAELILTTENDFFKQLQTMDHAIVPQQAAGASSTPTGQPQP